MNYYEHHIGDYDADTAHLSWLEDMAFTRLLRLYYRKERPIAADLAEACRLVRASTKEQRAAVESVLREFFKLESDGWHQKRCDVDVARYQKKAEHNREVGKLGGRPRKNVTQEEPANNPVGLIREPTKNPPQSPVPSPQETPPTPKGVDDGPDGFKAFWEAWPKSERKGARGKCLELWAKEKHEHRSAEIVSHVEAMAGSVGWTKQNREFVPAPIVYLRSRAWDGALINGVEQRFEGVV